MHDGQPPTLAEYHAIMRDRQRNLTDDPIGTHERTRRRVAKTMVPIDTEPDILRRSGAPVDGERTPEQALSILMDRQAGAE